MIHSTQSDSRATSAAGHRLHESLLQLGPGRGYAAVLTGPKGSGKSRILRDLSLTLPQWTVVNVAALPWNTSTDYSLLHTIVERLPAPFDSLGMLDADGLKTLIIIDDAHWADAATMRQVFETIRALRTGVVAAVFTFPDDAVGNPDFPIELLTQLADAVLHVPPLNAERLREFVFESVGAYLPAKSLWHLQSLTGGQPALVRELLDSVPSDHWHQPSPEVLIPDQWMRKLETRQQGHDFTVLNHLLAMDFPSGAPVDLLRTLDPAFEEQLSRALELGLVALSSAFGTQTLAFREPTDNAAARSKADPAVVAELHRRACEFYREAGDTDKELFHAAHGSSATDDDLSMRISGHADKLSAQGLWRAASHTYLLAARTSKSASLRSTNHLDSVEALVAASDISQAKLQTDVLSTGRVDARADSLRAYLALHEGRRRESQFLLNRAWNALEESDNHDPALRARIASRNTLFHVLDWNPAQLVYWSRVTRNWATPDSPAAMEASYISLVGQAALDGRRPQDVPTREESPELTQRRNMAMGWLDLVHDDPLSARQRFTQIAPRDGSQRISLWIDAWHARSLLLLGELRAAEAVVERGLARAEQFGISFLTPLILWTGATAAMYRGDGDLMRFYLSQLSVSHDVFAMEYIPSSMCRMLAAMSNNEQAAALRIGHSLHAFGEEKGATQPGFWPWEDVYAQLLVQSGHVDEAASVVEQAKERAAGSSIRSLDAKLAVPQASILIQRGDVEAGVRLLNSAAEQVEELPLPFYQARILYEYGRTLRRLGRRRIADDVFSRASDVFRAMGATEYVERCDRERRVSGIGTRLTGVGGLTPQEEEIAKHVADGASNREVAQELFLSSKTVEYHLTRVYRKLGIRTRAELPRALAEAS